MLRGPHVSDKQMISLRSVPALTFKDRLTKVRVKMYNAHRTVYVADTTKKRKGNGVVASLLP